MAEERRLAMRSTATNPQTGESETWEHVTDNSTPVSKTLREVTVTAPAPVEAPVGPAEEPTPEERRRMRAESYQNMLKERTRRRGALDRYGDDYQTIWQRGGYRNAEQRREDRRQELLQEALERERMRIDNESKADRNAIMRYDRTKRKNNVGL